MYETVYHGTQLYSTCVETRRPQSRAGRATTCPLPNLTRDLGIPCGASPRRSVIKAFYLVIWERFCEVCLADDTSVGAPRKKLYKGIVVK